MLFFSIKNFSIIYMWQFFLGLRKFSKKYVFLNLKYSNISIPLVGVWKHTYTANYSTKIQSKNLKEIADKKFWKFGVLK